MQQKIPEIRDAMLVSIIEANLDAVQASGIALYIEQAAGSAPSTHMRHTSKHAAKHGGRGYGVYTTPDTKHMCVHSTFQILRYVCFVGGKFFENLIWIFFAFRYGKIKFHKDLVSVGSRCGGQGTPAKNIAETLQQCQRYAKLGEVGKLPWNKDKTGYTGKMGGLNDDACIALQMLVYFPTLFYTKPEYASARGGIGDRGIMATAAEAA